MFFQNIAEKRTSKIKPLMALLKMIPSAAGCVKKVRREANRNIIPIWEKAAKDRKVTGS